MNIYSIYKATNLINGKTYIGFDSSWPARKNSHIRCVLSGDYPKVVFYNAMRKYGINNFIWEIIYQSLDGHYTLTVMEPFFIHEYNSYVWAESSNGYNMTLGGEGALGAKRSSHTKLKHKEVITNWHKNMSEDKKYERAKNCSRGQRKRFLETPESENTKTKKRIAHQGTYLIISPTGNTYHANYGLKEFVSTNDIGISYWQLINAYRKCMRNIANKRARKDENKWIVIRTDKST